MGQETGISMKDAKQASIVTIVAMVGGLVSSAGYQVVGKQDLFTQEDFIREKASIIEYENSKRAEMLAIVKTDVANQIQDQMESIRNELAHNRERLDRLIENTAKVGAMLEQHMRYRHMEDKKEARHRNG